MPKNSQKWLVFFLQKFWALKIGCCSKNLTMAQKHLKIWGIRNKLNKRKPSFFRFIIFLKFLKNVSILHFSSIFNGQTSGFIIFVKNGAFLAVFRHFFRTAAFLPLMEPFLTKKWSRIQNYIHLSFKWSKN